ncbi:MAG: hypothetical protein LBH70_09360 [Spirochaetaceae bacterium]|jgi:hypothetical protein|nr:hypothetical protein [Spirochaetaceae bacterium]
MNDVEPRDGYTPSSVLAKQGVTAIGSLIGGVGLLIAGSLPPVPGVIVGALVGVIGAGAALSKNRDDRKLGVLAAVAGGLTMFSKIGFMKPLAGTLLAVGAVGLLAVGVWNGVKFLKGLKN